MKKLKIAAMGVEHRHIFGQITGMLDVGCEFVGWWTENDNRISNDLEKMKYCGFKGNPSVFCSTKIPRSLVSVFFSDIFRAGIPA